MLAFIKRDTHFSNDSAHLQREKKQAHEIEFQSNDEFP